jgi:hypothetical protein
MDLFDKLALTMRRFEPRRTLKAKDKRFELMDLMETYSNEAILELTASGDGVFWTTRRPDAQRKLKVSLLDSVSDLRLPSDAWFRVGQTAPSGDFARARIEAFGRGHERLGRIEMLIGRRNYAYYFTDDPVLDQINAGATQRTPQLVPA